MIGAESSVHPMIVLEAIVIVAMLLAIAHAIRQYHLSLRVAADANLLPAPAPVSDAESKWPRVAILIPAHNEERVIGGCLEAMLALDYPSDRLSIVAINDRSKDATRTILDAFAARDRRIVPLHRSDSAKPGKSSAIADGMAHVDCEIAVFFDADYLPHPGLLKELVVPFRDPLVGATMGRVVPYNSDRNVLTQLLDLERRCGYAIDQHGRAVMALIPQFGGTVGGVRLEALAAVGGWKEAHLTEDTDLTFRLALGGWRVAYLDHARCYEEVPETWVARYKQVRRWSYGHNECMLDYFWPVLRARHLRAGQKLDAALVLTSYFFPFAALLGTASAIAVLAYGPADSVLRPILSALSVLLALTVVAPSAQTAVAAIRDGQPHVLSRLPLMPVSSLLSMVAASEGFLQLVKNRVVGRTMAWDKTQRFRPNAVATRV